MKYTCYKVARHKDGAYCSSNVEGSAQLTYHIGRTTKSEHSPIFVYTEARWASPMLPGFSLLEGYSSAEPVSIHTLTTGLLTVRHPIDAEVAEWFWTVVIRNSTMLEAINTIFVPSGSYGVPDFTPVREVWI